MRRLLLVLLALLPGCAPVRLSADQERILDAFNSCKGPGSTARLVFRAPGFIVEADPRGELQAIRKCMTERWGVEWVN